MLTLFVVCPVELDLGYLTLYREALLRWNKAGLRETQVILLPQQEIPVSLSDGFEVSETKFEQVNGYPVWDVMKAVRQAWPMVRGEYVSFDHPEFIWGPGRLEKTIEWLKGYRPIYGMGNLRRPGEWENINQPNSRDDISQNASGWFKSFLDLNLWEDGAEAFEYLQTTHWMYWAAKAQRPGVNPWIEDAFFAEKEWLDLWGFTRYELEMPFQDVYDLMQIAVRTLYQYGLVFDCVRMPQSVNRIMHLWHPRAWGSWTPEMRDWFFSQPDRWKKTSFADPKLWEGLIDFQHNPQKACEPVVRLRFGPRGTCVNYGVEISRWLNEEGGVEAMKAYYADRKERGLR